MGRIEKTSITISNMVAVTPEMSSEEELREPKSKKSKQKLTSKKSKKTESESEELESSDDEIEKPVDPKASIVKALSKTRFMSVIDFNGKKMVNIREYYKKESEDKLLPGKKGICLTAEQWTKLLEHAPKINNKLDIE